MLGLSTGVKTNVHKTQRFTVRQRWILATTILASGLTFFAGIASTIAIPTIQGFFGASLASLQWIINAYTLVLAAFLLICGSLADHWGQRRVFLIGILIFGVGGVLSGFATSVTQLIAWQVVQGLGAALLIPTTLALINICFPTEVRGRAIGLWGGLSASVGALGPFLAGWMIESFGWPMIYWVLGPLSLLLAFLALLFMPKETPLRSRRIDWLGVLLLAGGLLTISFGLIQGPVFGWTNLLVVGALLGGLGLLGMFVRVERTAIEPIVPLSIFKNPLVVGSNVVTLALYFGLFGMLFYLTLNLQQIQGMSPTQSGLAILPGVLMIVLFSGWAGSLADRIGPRRQMIVGPLLAGLGFAWLIIPGVGVPYFLAFFPGIVLQGFGMAITIAPLTKSALAVSPELSGAASGINNSVTRISTLLAVALLGAIMVTIFSSQLETRLATTALSDDERAAVLTEAPKLAGLVLPEVLADDKRAAARRAVQLSFISGFRLIMALSAAAALASAGIAALLIRNPERN